MSEDAWRIQGLDDWCVLQLLDQGLVNTDPRCGTVQVNTCQLTTCLTLSESGLAVLTMAGYKGC